MKLHEYQAKALFAAHGIPVQQGEVAASPADARRAYEALRARAGSPDAFVCNVKAQLHAGGRGKAGGVQLARSAEEAEARAARLIGARLVTHQTGPDGLPVSRVLVDQRVDPARELYLALTVDRALALPAFLACREGGVDIEEVARARPSAIARAAFDASDGPGAGLIERLAETLGLAGAQAEALERLACGMWDLCESRDASLIEINPLAVLGDGELLALDAKVTIDDNALFRQPELAGWRDPSQEDPTEYRASRIGISYVGLGGTIGCLVNGAGLAMATNDILTLAGGEPANFLDVGGGANVEQIARACEIILSDRKARVIFVNIFGGIMRCDWIADGLLKATEQLKVAVPIVVRLEGTNVEEGRRRLSGATHLKLISVEGMAAAARKAVELAHHAEQRES
ncbi:MAG TPA: ADP-forming succinate--CoA ligase subunit beta [bacterium]